MKVCEKCAAPNSDQRTFCVDCGERLGAPLSSPEAEAYDRQLRQKTERLYNREDPLHISLFDKVIGGFSLVGVLAALVTLVGGLTQNGYGWGSLVCFFLAVVECFVPKLMWELEELRLSHFTSDTTPGGLYGIFRRAGELLAFGVGVCFLLVSVGVINL